MSEWVIDWVAVLILMANHVSNFPVGLYIGSQSRKDACTMMSCVAGTLNEKLYEDQTSQ